jgi:hypothetical protein
LWEEGELMRERQKQGEEEADLNQAACTLPGDEIVAPQWQALPLSTIPLRDFLVYEAPEDGRL